MTLRKFAGFTLIELMVAVVVISILAAVAYPSYQDYVRKGKRAEGKAALLKTAQVQERFFTDQNRYATQAELATAYGVTAGTIIYSAENPNLSSGAYTLTVTPVAPTTSFTLTATPNGTFTDPDCGNLTLTSTGVRDRTGAAPMNRCW